MSEPSRHSSRHSKKSARHHTHANEKDNPQQPNDDLLCQFQQLAKQVEALGTQKTKSLYTDRDLHPNPFDKILYMPPFPRH